MGFAMSKVIVRAELEKLQNALKENNLQDLSKQINEELKSLSSTTLDIAITGVTGTGKSSLVNALRGMGDYDNDSAKTDIRETTKKPDKYTHPVFPNVTVWDLPGIGSPKFKANEYLQKTNFAKYDFFIIVASERFTENDILLTKEIQDMKKKYYFVRSKVDQSIQAEERNPDFHEEESLEKIRHYCCENLRKAGESNPRVFLLSSWNLSGYDFPLLLDTLENDLDGLKRQVIIESMPAFSKEALEKKKAAMEALIWKLALVSCAMISQSQDSALLVPELHPCGDISFLAATMKKFCQVFGLDEESLGRLAHRIHKPIDELKSAVKIVPLASQITEEFVLHLALKSDACRVLMAVEFALDFIPVLGSLVGNGTSFATTFYMLKSFLSDVKEDAENVLAKAAE
ncbi:PREDICTED: interferon-inducible GTPase 5-like [Gekko japonicus]|uniref:Interferon-inducible GTPase 5-like n=1 Tax=Gekko japonicus TaxID=146911 RepID=A0ABM1KBN9_GEKJA|nr:PREDICTED: interferon-inducible GTPase 5-like [Gekko japonicus]